MSEANRALVRRFVQEFWNEGNATAADELMAIDATVHMPTGEVVNPGRLKSFADMWRGSFPTGIPPILDKSFIFSEIRVPNRINLLVPPSAS